MYNYIKGIVTEIGSNYISLDNNGIGYMIYVSSPFSFRVEEAYKVYIYSYVREDEYTLYGFKTLEERELFLKLINVKGVGPKMAIPILTSPVDAIYDAIQRENIIYLTKFPKVGDKVARQIILDLKGKVGTPDLFNDSSLTEVMDALTSLGYGKADIKKVLPKINSGESTENQIKEALKLLMK